MSVQKKRLYFFLFAAKQSSVGTFNTLQKCAGGGKINKNTNSPKVRRGRSLGASAGRGHGAVADLITRLGPADIVFRSVGHQTQIEPRTLT